MSHEHEISTYVRNGRRVDMPILLEKGRQFQEESGWRPPTELAKEAAAQAAEAAAVTAPDVQKEGA